MEGKILYLKKELVDRYTEWKKSERDREMQI